MTPASDVINQVCRELKYSRSHVANVVRQNRRKLKAKKKGRRWTLPPGSKVRLTSLVRNVSGRRYKLGERGPHE